MTKKSVVFFGLIFSFVFLQPAASWAETFEECVNRDGGCAPATFDADRCNAANARCASSVQGGGAGAQGTLPFLKKVGGKAGYARASELSVATTVGNIIYGTLGLLGVIFLVLTVYAGFLWLTAGGNEENVAKAQKYLKNGIIGIAIVLAAFSITAFVLRVLIYSTLRAPAGSVEVAPSLQIE